MMRSQTVVLRVEWADEDFLAPASTWDWSELAGETVTVIAKGPVEFSENSRGVILHRPEV